jgi:hypothetical protein
MRNDDLAKRFVLYHLSHPEIWEAYERVILDNIENGRTRGGVNEVTETIRWGRYRQPAAKNANANAPFYARMFACAHPEHKDYFEYKSSAADYINYEPLLLLDCFGDAARRAEEALGWEDPQLMLELEEG